MYKRIKFYNLKKYLDGPVIGNKQQPETNQTVTHVDGLNNHKGSNLGRISPNDQRNLLKF